MVLAQLDNAIIKNRYLNLHINFGPYFCINQKSTKFVQE